MAYGPYGDPGLMMGGAGMLGALFALGAIMLLVVLAVYLYAAFALMAIAKRTKTPNGWLAFIPIANIYLMTQMAGVPWWYTFGVLLVFVPFLGGLAFAALLVYIWWKIAESIKRPGWWSLLLLVPVVNLVMMGIMAWG